MHGAEKLIPSILVVDDSVETLQIVEHALDRADFNVITAVTGEEALRLMAVDGLPHMVICDLHLGPGPAIDGFELCRRIYRWSDLPVIILTAVDRSKTIVEALEQHAEDYVVKPFMPDELVARARRVLARIGLFPFPQQMPIVVDNILRVNFPERTITVTGQKVSLTPTETRLLYLLLRRRGETIPYNYLLRRLWPHELVYEDRLHVFVHRLRNKLQGSRVDHEYVALERGVGYRFQPYPVSEAETTGSGTSRK